MQGRMGRVMFSGSSREATMRRREDYFGIGNANPESWRDHLYTGGWVYAILMLLTLVAVVVYATRQPLKTTTYAASPREQSWTACVKGVEERLGVAAASAEPFRPGMVTLLTQTQYEVRAEYRQAAPTRHRCVVEQATDGSWNLISVE